MFCVGCATLGGSSLPPQAARNAMVPIVAIALNHWNMEISWVKG
jgi:hypothetical protein